MKGLKDRLAKSMSGKVSSLAYAEGIIGSTDDALIFQA